MDVNCCYSGFEIMAICHVATCVVMAEALGWFTNSVQRPHILEEIKKMQQTANLPEDLKAELEPVSYTHLDVYKRQVRKRGRKRLS